MTAADRGDELDARIESRCAATGHLPWDPDTDPEACACGEVPPTEHGEGPSHNRSGYGRVPRLSPATPPTGEAP